MPIDPCPIPAPSSSHGEPAYATAWSFDDDEPTDPRLASVEHDEPIPYLAEFEIIDELGHVRDTRVGAHAPTSAEALA